MKSKLKSSLLFKTPLTPLRKYMITKSNPPGLALFAILLLFISTKTTHAANLDAINQQDWITRNQQNILEEKKRDAEFENIKKERERKKKEEIEQEESKENISSNPLKCFPIKEIKLNNANSISSFYQKKLTSTFIGKCLEHKVLSDLITNINSYYQNHGYITTQVLIPKQNLQNGIFELEIIEGKIEKISFGKNRFIEKMQEFTAFGDVENKTLNINDINQGIYQINRLQSNSATMKIEPGSITGLSNITIDNNKKFPANFTIARDNLGNNFTGIQRTNFSSNIDNLLFLNDNLNLNYTTNLDDNNHIKNIKSFSSTLSIPFKYNTLSFDYYKSEFRGQNHGNSGAIALTGFSNQRKITIDRVLLTSNNFRLASDISLTIKDSASFLNGEEISTSKRNLSIFNLGFSISAYLNDTTNIYLKPSYSGGLGIFGAQKDQKNISLETPKSQFEVFKLYAAISKKLTIPKVDIPILLGVELNGQIAKDTLFGSEQISIGGYYSVRGFRENYIAGNSGYYLRNKINFDIHPKIKLEPFYDYGYISNQNYQKGGSLSGAGIKGIFLGKYLNASLTYSWVVNKSGLYFSNEKENKMIYFELIAKCC